MTPIIPAMNTTWFWFDKKNRRKLHGTAEDVMRKFDLISSRCERLEGLEIFLFPKKVTRVDQFTPSFYKRFATLQYKSIHIGDTHQDFLYNSDSITDHLEILAAMLERLETDILVLHAHHLRQQRQKIRNLLLAIFPETHIYIENNGFDNRWGASIEGLTDIFKDCPEFEFCLDIAHVMDFSHQFQLTDFTSHAVLKPKLREIHLSYSTFHCTGDPYDDRGYPGYGPFHALFSVLGICPSLRTIEFVTKYPVILEGILPKEDRFFKFLKQEVTLLKQ